eukprot:449291_1
MSESKQQYKYPIDPAIEKWPKNEIKALFDMTNTTETPTLIKFSTYGRTLINKHFCAKAQVVSKTARRENNELKHLFEARVKLQLTYEHQYAHSLYGLGKFLEKYIGKKKKTIELINLISYVSPNNYKNCNNMQELYSITVFFSSSYPNEPNILLNKMAQFEKHVLRNIIFDDKIVNWAWKPYSNYNFPYKYYIYLPKLSVVYKPNIRDPETINWIWQNMMYNVPRARPSNMTISIDLDSKTGQLNLNRIQIATNYKPYIFTYNKKEIYINTWRFGQYRWRSLQVKITLAGKRPKEVNPTALINNDSATGVYHRIYKITDAVEKICQKIHIDAWKVYKNKSTTQFPLHEIVSSIQARLLRDLEVQINTPTIIKHGINNDMWITNIDINNDRKSTITFKFQHGINYNIHYKKRNNQEHKDNSDINDNDVNMSGQNNNNNGINNTQLSNTLEVLKNLNQQTSSAQSLGAQNPN